MGFGADKENYYQLRLSLSLETLMSHILYPLPAQVELAALFLVAKKNRVRRLKKGQSCVKKPGESNRDLFRALRGGV